MTDSHPRKKTPRRPARKARAKKTRRLWFQAMAQRDHVHLQANVPTRWLSVFVKIFVVILIAFLILKMPEVWQAVQAAINALPK